MAGPVPAIPIVKAVRFASGFSALLERSAAYALGRIDRIEARPMQAKLLRNETRRGDH
jgi:hypothetical protein